MSATNGNKIYLNGVLKATINQGESYGVMVKEGDKIESKDPVQADLCTGDIGSNYEMRWFSLTPVELWGESYMTAVGDSFGNTRMMLYNPSNHDIQVTFEWKEKKGDTSTKKKIVTVKKDNNEWTPVIPTGSGAKVYSTGNNFLALSITDSKDVGGSKENLDGNAYDWGFPVVGTEQLTPEVVIGWGFGCTNIDCGNHDIRSAVWVSPVQNCYLYVDLDNDGTADEGQWLKALDSVRLRDYGDHDMSGAKIWCQKSQTDKTPVDIAAAWGQDPSVSRPDQHLSLDMGTVVLPFTSLKAKKSVDKSSVEGGETLTYTITVQNVGENIARAGSFTIYDPLIPEGDYVPGSTKYSMDMGKSWTNIADDTRGSKYPLDIHDADLDGESGYTSEVDMERRGSEMRIQFKVKVIGAKISSGTIVNKGWLDPKTGRNLEFKANTKTEVKASIKLDSGVYKGDSGKGGCNNATEEQEGPKGTKVTYCLKITNTGPSALGAIKLSDPLLGLQDTHFSIPNLGPGEWHLVSLPGTIDEDLKNTATVSGLPLYPLNNKPIEGMSRVSDTDPSEVKKVDFKPSVKIENTVMKDHVDASSCGNAGDSVEGFKGADVTYCLEIVNDGDTLLKDVYIDDPKISFQKEVGTLQKGESKTYTVHRQIPEEAFPNTAFVKGAPFITNTEPVPGISSVTDDDDSGVVVKAPIDTTVKNGDKCGVTDYSEVPVGCAKCGQILECYVDTTTKDSALYTNTYNFLMSPEFCDSKTPCDQQCAMAQGMKVYHKSEMPAGAIGSSSFKCKAGAGGGAPAALSNWNTYMVNAPIVRTDCPMGEPKCGTKCEGTGCECTFGSFCGGDPPVDPDPTPVPPICMQDAYDDNYKTNSPPRLVCRKKQVFIEKLVSTDSRGHCKVGEKITLSLKASVHFNTDKYDPGYYIALDGGDAMTGTCARGALTKDGSDYQVTGAMLTKDIAGKVERKDAHGSIDVCGDVFFNGGGGNIMLDDFAEEIQVTCADHDNDGNLDISICFTWRDEDKDDTCTVGPGTGRKNLPDLFPGTPTRCNCERVEVENISVDTPDDRVSPC